MSSLDGQNILTALRETGARLKVDHAVEILLVGGAAGVLLGALPPAWTTADVDLIHCYLPQDREAVLNAAEEAALALSLPSNWLSDDVGLYAWTLPRDWHARRVEVGIFGLLRVYVIGRADLIAMKFIAHRERDLEHLAHLRVRADELQFVRNYLDELARTQVNEIGRIEMARRYLQAWEA